MFKITDVDLMQIIVIFLIIFVALAVNKFINYLITKKALLNVLEGLENENKNRK